MGNESVVLDEVVELWIPNQATLRYFQAMMGCNPHHKLSALVSVSDRKTCIAPTFAGPLKRYMLGGQE